MAIRVSHQPSGSAVGIAAYTAGFGQGRERKQRDLMELMFRMQRRGNIYRQPRQRLIQQPEQQGTWTDPAEKPFLSSKERMQIQSQREANARAQRMGQAVPFPDAEQQFTPAPTKQELQWQHQEQVAQRNRQWQLQDEQRRRQYTVQDRASAETLDIFKDRYGSLREQIDKLAALGPEAWADPARRKEFNKLRDALRIAEGNLGADGQQQVTPLEVYRTGAQKMGEFLSGHKETHLLPASKRPGATYEYEGWVWRNTEDGAVRVRPVDEEKSFRGSVRKFEGVPGYWRQERNRQGIPTGGWEPVTIPQANEAAKQREKLGLLARKIMSETKGKESGLPTLTFDEALVEAKRVLGISGESDAASGPPRVKVGADGSFQIPDEGAGQQPTSLSEGPMPTTSSNGGVDPEFEAMPEPSFDINDQDDRWNPKTDMIPNEYEPTSKPRFYFPWVGGKASDGGHYADKLLMATKKYGAIPYITGNPDCGTLDCHDMKRGQPYYDAVRRTIRFFDGRKRFPDEGAGQQPTSLSEGPMPTTSSNGGVDPEFEAMPEPSFDISAPAPPIDITGAISNDQADRWNPKTDMIPNEYEPTSKPRFYVPWVGGKASDGGHFADKLLMPTKKYGAIPYINGDPYRGTLDSHDMKRGQPYFDAVRRTIRFFDGRTRSQSAQGQNDSNWEQGAPDFTRTMGISNESTPRYGPAITTAIARARKGDTKAQKALARKGIPWRR